MSSFEESCCEVVLFLVVLMKGQNKARSCTVKGARALSSSNNLLEQIHRFQISDGAYKNRYHRENTSLFKYQRITQRKCRKVLTSLV